MDIIRMTGGLGNQMFQYALYLKLKSMGRIVKFDDFTEYEKENARPILLWCFGLSYEKATRKELNMLTDGFMRPIDRIRRKIFGRKSLEYHEKDCNFDPLILERTPAYLTGYFQSERYFSDIADQVRKAFTFDERVIEKHAKKLYGIEQNAFEAYQKEIRSTASVAIHMRRGDYVTGSAIYGGNCTDEYYEKAIEMIKEKIPKAHFFMFSNDSDYVKEWLLAYHKKEKSAAASDFTIITGAAEKQGYLDLYLMSACQHFVIANSSFSWWGAWLSQNQNKIMIAPDRWFNNQDCRDIYTAAMIRIDEKGQVKEGKK